MITTERKEAAERLRERKRKNGRENDGDKGGEITGGENDGLERIDGNRL